MMKLLVYKIFILISFFGFSQTNYSGKVIDKLTKLFEQGLISSKDLTSELLTILRSKRDELVFRLKLTSKDEFEILSKRVEILEKKIEKIKLKKNPKSKRAKKL